MSTVCVGLVVDADTRWPLDQDLLVKLSRICHGWLIGLTGNRIKPAEIERYIDSVVPGFPGSVLTVAPGANPYPALLSATRGRATHLWLVDPASIVLLPRLFEFRNLAEACFIAHGVNEHELIWRRSLVDVSVDWAYSELRSQWEPDVGNPNPNSAHLEKPRVQLLATEWSRRRHAIRRKQVLLGLIDDREANAFECAELGRSFEELGDLKSAASWYYAGAVASEGNPEWSGYGRYRYWMLVRILGEASGEVWKQRWLEVFEQWPQRAEPLYSLLEVLIDAQEWNEARQLLQVALNIEYPEDEAPWEAWIYEYGLHYLAARVANATEDDEGVLRHTVAAMLYAHLPREIKTELYRWQSEAYERRHPLPLAGSRNRNHFVVVVPFRNCARFLQATVDSLAGQSYRDFEVVFMDDMSTDGGLGDCDLTGLPAHTRVHREKRLGALANQLDALQNYCEPGDIAVFLDGDDRLADDAVLEYLNRVYAQTGCWLTYGQFAFDDGEVTGYARPMLESETIDQVFGYNGFRFPMHLRTHRAGLIHALLRQDPNLKCWQGDGGGLVQCASDVAHMRAMMMLTPRDRIRYISRVLYRYNTNNPNSHFKGAGKVKQALETRRICQGETLRVVDRY